jgi:DNA-binding transcriptional MerR regulator
VDDATLTIGQVAHRAGLKTSAIRYYESVGLLPEARRESGQRRYGDDTLRRLQVIDVAKRAGFSLDEARVLLATGDGGPPAHAPVARARRAQAARGRRAHRPGAIHARVARHGPRL